MDETELAMRDLTRWAHAGQTRGGGIPYWVHTDGVAQYLRAAIERAGELTGDHAADVVLAGYGHDLYEDTDVTAEQIEARFGPRVAGWIAGMTNEQGDHDRAAYQAKIQAGPEEVRLIKCADLADNALSVAYGLHDLGLAWPRSSFLPIAADTITTLNSVPYVRFPETGRMLLDLANLAWERLQGAVDVAGGQAWAGDRPQGVSSTCSTNGNQIRSAEPAGR